MEIRCRLCGEPYHNQIEVLENTRFLSVIDLFFQLKISSADNLPSTVCENCYEFVERIWQFKEQVDRAQIVLNSVLISSIDILPNVIGTQVSDIPGSICDKGNGFETAETNLLKPVLKPALSEEADDKNIEKESHTRIQDNDIKSNTPNHQKSNITSKKTKKSSSSNKKIKKQDSAETFKDIEYVNPDGTVVPKRGIAGWNSYQWTCPECSTVFFEADELREHLAADHNIFTARYICLDCPKVYYKYVSFISHVRYHRPLLKYSCDICYKWYATSKEIELHQTSHHKEEPYFCRTCGKTFRLQSLLTLHTRSHLPSDIKNCYQCDQCPKKFGTKQNLLAHKRIHYGIKDYTCDQCGKSFVQKGNLDNHLLTHDSTRPFRCTVCDKSFKSLIQLRKHSSIHLGLKPFQCDICGRQFRERGTLKEHHRIHTGDMPFSCEFCGKCFRFKGVLTTHRRQHTGERPYSCTECQHHFTNWPNYNKHMKRRHGINTSVNCRTKQEIPPTGKPYRNPPGTVLAAPQPAPSIQVACPTQSNTDAMEYSEAPTSTFYPVLGLY
ncbi:unnamed protein product [Ceutorhynchus assimilis]|uniref:Uncharacterized protein n=1 Tax=Ceutorhynchus assimilis TaxID=467358 RepID=A0A9N9QS43_9CUCU|nr:unnamed protein product [Ceutorhynchus assimilis]